MPLRFICHEHPATHASFSESDEDEYCSRQF
jgi:hypothetical protein